MDVYYDVNTQFENSLSCSEYSSFVYWNNDVYCVEQITCRENFKIG